MKALFLLAALALVLPADFALACRDHATNDEASDTRAEAVRPVKTEKVAKKNESAGGEESAALFPLGAMEQVAP